MMQIQQITLKTETHLIELTKWKHTNGEDRVAFSMPTPDNTPRQLDLSVQEVRALAQVLTLL